MYQHTQAGTLIRVLLILMIFVMLVDSWFYMRGVQRQGILLPDQQDVLLRFCGVIFILLTALALFHNLSVSVKERQIYLSYGVGIIHRRIPLDRISSVRAVTNKWWYGWGIRLIPGGWMWNVTGLEAIELELRNGRKFRIGTDEPEQLAGAIRSRLATR